VHTHDHQIVAVPGSVLKVSVKNDGVLAGTLRATVAVDDAAQSDIGAPIAGHATRSLTVQLPTALTPGKHTVTIAGRTVSFIALRPAVFHVTDLSLVPTPATVHDTVVVVAEVTNTGEATGVFPGELTVNDRTAPAKPLTIAGGQIKSVSYQVRRTKPGYYTFRLGDSAPSTIPIVKPERPANGAVLARTTSGSGRLTFEDKEHEDMVAVLSATAGGGRDPALAFYIRAGKSVTMTGIADGHLYVYFESGQEWNRTTRDFLQSDDRERFKRSAEFSTSSWTTSYTDWSNRTIYTTKHTRYTDWKISVSNKWVWGPAGGSVDVTAARFPKL